VGTIVSDELGRMWKETVVAYFEVNILTFCRLSARWTTEAYRAPCIETEDTSPHPHILFI